MNISVNNLKEYILENSTFANENTIDLVIDNILKVLKSYNFDLNNINVESGETSINFIEDNIVVRLTYVRYKDYDTISDYIKNSKYILKPKYEKSINTGSVNYPTILVMDRLDIGSVTKKERDNIYIKLRDDGYIFNDAEKLDNFGKDKDGNIYLIDYGELIYVDPKQMNDSDLYKRTMYNKKIEKELEYHSKKCKRLNSKYTRYRNLKQLLNIKEKIKKSKKIDKNNKIR